MRRRRLFSCASILSLLCPQLILLLAPIHVSAAENAVPRVVIGEIGWAGSSVGAADEWLELWNLEDESVSLAGWSIAGAGESGRAIPLPPDAAIPAQGLYLLTNYPEGDVKSALEAHVDLATSTLSLSNTQLDLRLLRADGSQVDATKGAPAAGASSPARISMRRQDPAKDGTQADAWTSAVERLGFRGETTDLGTPGFCDECVIPAEFVEPILPEEMPPVLESTSTNLGEDAETSEQEERSATTSTDASMDEAGHEGTGETPSEQASSTVIAMLDAAPTSTETILESTTSSALTPVLSTQASSSAQAAVPSSGALPHKPAYGLLRLNEIFPAPSSGKEWIEILSLDASNPIPLEGCELRDAEGVVLRIGKITIDPVVSRYATTTLASAKLNNTGDHVSLYAPDGQLIDTMSFPATDKDTAWIHFPEADGVWQHTLAATPGTTNTLSVAMTSMEMPSTPAPVLSTTTFSPDEPAENPSSTTARAKVVTKTNAASLNTPKMQTKTEEKKTKTVEAVKKTTAPIKKTTAKSTNATKIEPTIPITFDTIPSLSSPMRIRLTGTVGTPPGLIPGHAFILQSEDGRGLLVTLAAGHRLPDFGSQVTLTGRIEFTDLNTPKLVVAAKDVPVILKETPPESRPRAVDLVIPATEDAWSLVHVTGTVKSIQKTIIELDLEDSTIDIQIRPSVNYRTSRLRAGDVLAVSGIFDSSHEEMRIMPRSAEDLVLVRHAPVETISAANGGSAPSSLPGWTPFGAAAGAVGTVEGAKRLRERRARRKLERKLEEITRVGSPT